MKRLLLLFFSFLFIVCSSAKKQNHIPKIIFHIRNCNDVTETSCQLFQTWRFGKESCAVFEEKHAFWSPIFRKIEPEVKCPVPAGDFTLKNGSLDMDLLTRLPFPLEKYYWRVRLECFDPETIVCMEAEARFLRIRSTLK